MNKHDWINVSEELPDLKISFSNGFNWESDAVLVCGKYFGACIMRLYASEGKKEMWWWDKRHGEEKEGISHWMPLPENPDFE